MHNIHFEIDIWKRSEKMYPQNIVHRSMQQFSPPPSNQTNHVILLLPFEIKALSHTFEKQF